MFEIEDALRACTSLGASDLHLKVPAPPMVRVNGDLRPLEGASVLSDADLQGAVAVLTKTNAQRAEFEQEGEVDCAHQLKTGERFRVNAFRQRGSISIVCRAIPAEIPTLESLGLPGAIRTLAEEHRGIILCTGTTGSGKSTTLAAMVNHINTTAARHVVTIEDPIEYLHTDQKSIINQREIGNDTASFSRALRRVLRQDPDVILIGEMRDEETVRTALTAAETGHLVLSTLHTVDAVETVNRIVDFFPPHQQQQARVMLASTLRGVISQRLVKTSDIEGRAAACEILCTTGRVRDLILKPNETSQISDVIAEGEYYGMQTFDQALLGLYRDNRISFDEAINAASRPHDFKLMIASEVPESATQATI